jgi:hypothetical protein
MEQAAVASDAKTSSQPAVEPQDTANVQEPLEKPSGDSMTSFDELEAVENFKVRETQQKAEQNVKVKQEEQKIEGKDKKADAKPKKAKAKAETETETETEGDEQVLEEKPVKKFKVKSGEEDFELRSDSLHTVKIDGKAEKVTYQDLVNGYSGSEAVKSRFDELAKTKQEFIAERNQFIQERDILNGTVNDLVTELKTNPAQGLATLAELGGQNGVDFSNAFFENLIPLVREWAELSEDQRAFKEEQMRVERDKKDVERTKRDVETQKSNAEIQREIDTLKHSHSIDDQEFSEAFFELETLQKEGKFEGVITPQTVANAVVDNRLENQVVGVLEVVRPSMVEDFEAIDDILDVLTEQDPAGNWSDDDIKKIVTESFPVGDPSEDELALNKKVRSSKDKSVGRDAKQPDHEVISFDELEF